GFPTELKPGTNQFLTTDDGVSAPILPNFHPTPCIHIPGEVRNLLELCQVETILEVNNVPTNATSLMERLRFPVSAQAGKGELCAVFRADPGRSGPWQSTLLGQLCGYYTQWSGSLEVTFMFTGSFMATGKMLIAYTPPGGPLPKDRATAMLGTHVIWDFGLQSSVTLVIPTTGLVSIWYQTNYVVPIGAPNTAYIIALAAAQKNFTMQLCKDASDIL
uniref:VP3 n=1 Tax=Human enterovirus 71 TaxID=39054 RepID=UPI0027E5BE64|nr:Chain C, VP3 [Enterovirus A71]